MLAFILECLILCIILTVIVVSKEKKDPINMIYDFPRPLIERCYELGLIKEKPRDMRRSTVIKKVIATAVLGIPMGFLVTYVNGAQGFWQGFLMVLGIIVVVSAYDVLMDIVWFCHDDSMIIPGTEDLIDCYHDYGFHVRASLRGILICSPAAVVAGVVTALLT